MGKRIGTILATICLCMSLAVPAQAAQTFFGQDVSAFHRAFNEGIDKKRPRLPEKLEQSRPDTKMGLMNDHLMSAFSHDENNKLTLVSFLLALDDTTILQDGEDFGYCVGVSIRLLDPSVNQTALMEKLRFEDFETEEVRVYTERNMEYGFVVDSEYVAFTMGVSTAESEAVDPEIKVLLDGSYLKMDVAPQMIDNRTFVPLRAIFEGLGATVVYDAKTKGITATKADTKIQLTVNSNQAYVNGKSVILDVPAKEIGGRTLVPVRFVSESLHCGVDWQKATKTVNISSNGAGSVKPVVPEKPVAPKKPVAPVAPEKPVTSKNPVTISKAEYDKCVNGMTYEEVCAIIGSKGEEFVSSGDVGSEYYAVVYQWDGTGDMLSTASMTFQGNKLQAKAQYGLR